MRSDRVSDAVEELLRVLGPHAGSDWHVRAGRLEWTCWQTAAHIAHDLLAYAGQVTACPDSAYLPVDLVVAEDASVEDLFDVVQACGTLLTGAVRSSDEASRAWHWGPTDPGGFAALGTAEVLVHTWDITQALHPSWSPPDSLAADVLERLFPDAPDGSPPEVLLWATGRIELDGRPPARSWVYRAALE